MTATPPSVTGLYVGTSGFSYATWRPGFYPPEARPEEFLSHYSRRLPSVELNTTFYRLPAEEQFRRWAKATPAGFRFAVKATRGIAHGGRLEQLPTFAERVRALGDRLGPLRIKLHDDRPRDDGFLALLLGSLDPDLRLALEAAHPSWDGAEPLLAEAGAVRVGALDTDAPFCYLRLREPPYDEAALAAWADRLAPLLAAGKDVYCYFKHEDEPDAPRYAARLAELAAAVAASR